MGGLILRSVLVSLMIQPYSGQMCDVMVDITAASRIRVPQTGRVCLRCLNANGQTSTATIWSLSDGSVISSGQNNAPTVGMYADGVLVLLPGVLGNGSAGEYGPISCTSIDITPEYNFFDMTLYSSVLLPPIIPASSVERRAEEGAGPAFLVCNNPNSPEVANALQWFKVAAPATPQSTSGILIFSNPISRNSSGQYDCQLASLINGETASARATLIVEYSPQIFSVKANTTLLPNATLSLTCNYDAVPMPSVQWLLNGMVLDTADPRMSVSLTNNSSELRIGSVACDEEGVYSCRFENRLGSSLRSITTLFIMKHEPEPPVNVNAFAVGAHWIALKWTPTFDGCTPVLNFVLFILNAKIPQGFMPLENLTANELVKSGNFFMYNVSRSDAVLPSTVYSFRVVSCNVVGCSDHSQDSEPRQTLEDMILFQLRLVGVVNCNDWITDSPVLKATEVIQGIAAELRELCQCDFEADLISNAGFQCFPESPTAVTFRAVMTGTPQVSAPELVILLGDWISSGAFINIQAQLLSADGSCAVTVYSLGERECNLHVPYNAISSTVFGSVIAVAVFFIIVVLTVMLCLVAVLVKKRKNFRLQAPPATQQHEPSECSSGSEHLYEKINDGGEAYDELKLKGSSQSAGIELTVCPAYLAGKSATAGIENRKEIQYDMPAGVKPKNS